MKIIVTHPLPGKTSSTQGRQQRGVWKENKAKMPSDRLDYAVSSVVRATCLVCTLGAKNTYMYVSIYVYIYVHYLYRRDLMNVDVEEGR